MWFQRKRFRYGVRFRGSNMRPFIGYWEDAVWVLRETMQRHYAEECGKPDEQEPIEYATRREMAFDKWVPLMEALVNTKPETEFHDTSTELEFYITKEKQ
jgi:hypothetical protein